MTSGVVELTESEPQWFEWDVYMEAGFEPEVRFRNGPMAAKRMVRLLTTQAADRPEFQPFINLKAGTEKAHGVLKSYQGPRLRIWQVELEGPQVEVATCRSPGSMESDHRSNHGGDNSRGSKRLPSLVSGRPLKRVELDPRSVSRKQKSGMQPLMRCNFHFVLPGFLYLNLGEENCLNSVSIKTVLLSDFFITRC